jgi:hypothetical protein
MPIYNTTYLLTPSVSPCSPPSLHTPRCCLRPANRSWKCSRTHWGPRGRVDIFWEWRAWGWSSRYWWEILVLHIQVLVSSLGFTAMGRAISVCSQVRIGWACTRALLDYAFGLPWVGGAAKPQEESVHNLRQTAAGCWQKWRFQIGESPQQSASQASKLTSDRAFLDT